MAKKTIDKLAWPQDGPPMWTIEEGLKVVQMLESFLSDFRVHCALGGGVMKNGHSHKDLVVGYFENLWT